MPVDLPHFALPFRFAGATTAVLEQDTTDEIMACALAIVLCPEGFRVELPTFGVPDPTFMEGVARTDAYLYALGLWEPRSHENASAWIDELDEFVSHVRLRIAASSED